MANPIIFMEITYFQYQYNEVYFNKILLRAFLIITISLLIFIPPRRVGDLFVVDSIYDTAAVAYRRIY